MKEVFQERDLDGKNKKFVIKANEYVLRHVQRCNKVGSFNSVEGKFPFSKQDSDCSPGHRKPSKTIQIYRHVFFIVHSSFESRRQTLKHQN